MNTASFLHEKHCLDRADADAKTTPRQNTSDSGHGTSMADNDLSPRPPTSPLPIGGGGLQAYRQACETYMTTSPLFPDVAATKF